MIFSNENLRLLKGLCHRKIGTCGYEDHTCQRDVFEDDDVQALIDRLEGSESLLDRAMRRLRLINGDESKCCMNPDSCMNHSLLREYEKWHTGAGK